ncbi:MAG TPA: hypothetical protein VN887_10195 [Candidatus Angelobacter sp.]|nr:hypothetical protein [Candidatus Angelobacter sp.]
MPTRDHPQRVIIISGVRYYVDIRLDIPWSYGEEWCGRDEVVDRARVEASVFGVTHGLNGQIHEARCRTEPWLHTELVHGE